MSDAAAPAGERIAKVLARAGLCSRRDAERWIVAGRVSVNGVALTSPARNVTQGDQVMIDGKPLPQADKRRLWRYYKPAGLVTTHRDERDRPTVFAALPADMPRVVSVGRLDLNSEGLLLLTNDGALARLLEHPTRGWTRRYRVRVHGRVDADALAGLAKGITVDGISYGPITAALDKTQGKGNAWLTMALKEGKNRELRRVLKALGLKVTRLIRIAYGPFQLGTLVRGEVDEVPGKVIREQVGSAI
jgi:23S rRNA pseudouridine2605 synthase